MSWYPLSANPIEEAFVERLSEKNRQDEEDKWRLNHSLMTIEFHSQAVRPPTVTEAAFAVGVGLAHQSTLPMLKTHVDASLEFLKERRDDEYMFLLRSIALARLLKAVTKDPEAAELDTEWASMEEVCEAQ